MGGERRDSTVYSDSAPSKGNALQFRRNKSRSMRHIQKKRQEIFRFISWFVCLKLIVIQNATLNFNRRC
jgi:hypothetical protein